MCTAISFNAHKHYFGRNLDYEHDFGEKIVITPRDFVFKLRNGECIAHHYAMIGMAVVSDDFPLYFDATNEMGLSMAGLNFPGNAVYFEPKQSKTNIASFEFVPWVLSKCKNINEAKMLIDNLSITNEAFSSHMQPSPLHWIICDKDYAITVEQTKDGLKVYDNPIGVLTNNPPFDFHITNLSNYMAATSDEATNRFSDKIDLLPHSKGMGGIGIPGDLSSVSRFVRAAFTKLNSVAPLFEAESVCQFFHILYSVYQQKGSVKIGDSYEITNYTSCCDTDRGIYYYTTYNNFSINAIDMYRQNLDEACLYVYDLEKEQIFNFLN